MLLPAVTLTGPVFVTARSAPGAATLVVTVALLLPGVGSGVLEVAEAVLEMTVPLGVPAVMFTTMLKVPVAPEASAALVKVIAPVPPTAGVVVVQPPGAVAETKVVLVGTLSVRMTVVELLGPLLIRF